MTTRKTNCQIGDLHRQISVPDKITYLVACRELGVVVSEHVKYAGALAAMVRKQPHWVQKIYDERRPLLLYVYSRTSANTFEIIN